MARLPNYLLSNRKRLGLSQSDVAFLLGAQSGAKVCRYERFVREPNLETALAYEAILGKPVRELFGGVFERVEKEVVERAKVLRHRTDLQKPAQPAERKLQALARLCGGPSRQPGNIS